jgi:excisionase family DNA binding protein
MALKRTHKGVSLRSSGTIYASVEELAAELGISRQSAYAGLREGTIPSIRLGKRFIIAKSAISEWLKHSGTKAASESD